MVGAVDNDNYQGTASGTLVIAPASQSITFHPIGSVAVGQTIDLAATASSGLPITYHLRSGSAILTNGKVKLTGAGTVSLAADQIGNANYKAAKEVTTSFVVKPASQP